MKSQHDPSGSHADQHADGFPSWSSRHHVLLSVHSSTDIAGAHAFVAELDADRRWQFTHKDGSPY